MTSLVTISLSNLMKLIKINTCQLAAWGR